MSSSRPRLTAGFCLARSSSWKNRTPPMRSLKNRTSMLYCVQTPAVLARQVLHDVVGGGGERVFRRFDLVVRRAGGARVASRTAGSPAPPDPSAGPAPARASDARRRPSSSSSEAAARISGLAATVTRSTEMCGDSGRRRHRRAAPRRRIGRWFGARRRSSSRPTRLSGRGGGDRRARSGVRLGLVRRRGRTAAARRRRPAARRRRGGAPAGGGGRPGGPAAAAGRPDWVG